MRIASGPALKPGPFRATRRAGSAGLLAAVLMCVSSCGKDTDAPPAKAAVPPATDSVELNANQVKALKLGTVATHAFRMRHSAVGTIDFDENLAVQVFAPYQGRILKPYVDIGDEVRRGQTLYTIDSPDLLQAESTLITDAGQLELTVAALARARDLYAHQGMAQKDYEQAVSDEMSAEGALKAARDAVRIFGKSDRDIDAIVKGRSVDSTLIIPSPVAGRIVARNAQPGLLVQPGNPPAPYQVADLATYWMLAYVTENDVDTLAIGQPVSVSVPALGNFVFRGNVKAIGATLDPNTHTAVVRSEVRDPGHRLRPGMLATFTIETGAPADSVAIPANGIVREGDGTMSAWVTTDQRKFTRRTVAVGLQEDGVDQILSGVRAGELAVVDGAIFLSNILSGAGGDD